MIAEDMAVKLAVIETKLDSALESRLSAHADVVKDIADHEARIRLLERMWWKTAGVASAIGALIALGAGFVTKLM